LIDRYDTSDRGILFFVFDRCVTHTHTKHTHTDTGRSIPDDPYRTTDRSIETHPIVIDRRAIDRSNRIESNPHLHPHLHLHPNVVVVVVASRYRASTRVTLVVVVVVVDVVFER